MKNKPSVLIVGNFLSKYTGSRFVCEDLAERLLNAGWEVFTTSNKPDHTKRLFDMLKTVWTRRNQYNVATLDIFTGKSFYGAEVVAFVLRKLGKPYILTLRGGNLPNFAKKNPGRVFRLFKSAAAVTAPSRYLLEKMKCYRSDLVLIPNPLDISRYSFKIRSEPHPTLMWLRAYNKYYNAPMALFVAESLLVQYPRIRLMMAGPDKGDGSFQKTKLLAEKLRVSNSVEFAGIIPKAEVPTWLQKGDIFINTTNVDNTPISVMEAMACGLCVVSTNVGGIPYLLEDGQNALLIPPDDPEEMALAVRRILTEPGLSARLTENARRQVEQFDWSVVLPKWEGLLEDVIQNS